MSHLVEALSRIATAGIDGGDARMIKTQEGANKLFKYAKYITRFCRKKFKKKD